MKLGLGTVQFGLNYGINNSRGRPTPIEVRSILRCAQTNGIMTLDTAADYGDSEEILGKFIPENGPFQVVTKISRQQTCKASIQASIKRLNIPRVYGALFHDYSQFMASPDEWDSMKEIKALGLVEKIGFSLYLPEQLLLLMEKQLDFDIVQLPYSVFDRRFEQYFPLLKKAGVIIHTRSVFVQGLVFSNPDRILPFFGPIKNKIHALASLAKTAGKPIESLCLNFVCKNPNLDKVIVGVDTAENLLKNIEVLKDVISPAEEDVLNSLQENNEMMILPFNWKT